MTEEQLNKLLNYTGDLELIKLVSNQSFFRINVIIDFLKMSQSFDEKEKRSFINRIINIENNDILEIYYRIFEKCKFNQEDLKKVLDEVDKIKNIKKYDSRVDALKFNRFMGFLNASELIRLINSKRDLSFIRNELDELVNEFVIDGNIDLEEMHRRIDEILSKKDKKESKVIEEKQTVDTFDGGRNQGYRDQLMKDIIASSKVVDFTKAVEIRETLSSINEFVKLWNLENIFSLYRRNGKELTLDQKKVLIDINSVCSSYISSKINEFFEKDGLVENRTFDEILSLINEIVPYKYLDGYLDSSYILVSPSVLNERSYEETIYFYNILCELEKKEHDLENFKSLYELAIPYIISFEKQKEQFNYVAGLSERDKTPAAKVFLSTRPVKDISNEECKKYIEQIIKCDSIEKKQFISNIILPMARNENLTEEERMQLVKVVKNSKLGESRYIADIISSATSFNFDQIIDLINLDDNSYIATIMLAQQQLRIIKKIEEAQSIDEIKEVFKDNSYSGSGFHF